MFLKLLFLICVHAFEPNDPLTPMLGWASWNTFFEAINETLIQDTAIAMVKNGMKDAGYRYINVDEGFQGLRNAQGAFQYNTAKFPAGMRALADFIHGQGLNAGIYSDAGADTCGAIWDNQNTRGVGLENHEDADTKLFFQDWDYDFIKVDYCGANATKLEEKATYTMIHNAIVKNQPAGKPAIRFNICRWIFPGAWASEIAGSWRMSDDISNNFLDDRGVVGVLKRNLYLSPYASPGHFNDMDMMQIGRKTFTADEERSHFGLWAIMSSPILIGCDLRSIPQNTIDIITNEEVLAVNQDVLGLQAKVVSRGTANVVLAKPLENAQGTARAVALFNWGEAAVNLSINFEDIQLTGQTTVRDLFARKEVGVYNGSYEARVAPHAILLLRLEGRGYTDKLVYDGQDIFLHDFTLINQGDTARVTEFAEGSSGLKITYLGNASTNWGEFRNVYVSTAGNYELTITYYCNSTARQMDVTVNDMVHHLTGLTGPNFNTKQTITLTVALQKGANVVRLAQTSGFAPDIDRLVFRGL